MVGRFLWRRGQLAIIVIIIQQKSRQRTPLFEASVFARLTRRADHAKRISADHVNRISIVERSGLFDRDWYLKQYPDVASTGLDPLRHFVERGSAEGRSPGPGFDAAWYLSRYSDVRAAGIEPLFHYLEFGVAEKRLPISRTNEDVVSDYWGADRKAESQHSWLENKVILDCLHRRVSGDPQVGTYSWVKQKYFPAPVSLCLSLGCGLGDFERGAIGLGIAKKFHAYDISSGAIETAQKRATAAGLTDQIEYGVQNLENVVLPAKTYDAIFMISSAHHIFNLENLFFQCRDALKPGGLMILDEYIGPTRFQSSPLVTEIINKMLAILPSRYRKNLFTNDGRTIDSYAPFSLEEFERNDPSEAIRSGEIVNVLKLYFDIVDLRPYGGAILHMLFSGIMGNFDESNDTDVTLLRTISAFEEILEKVGAINSDFAAIVAKPRQTVLS
jgi:2-polyprenyl-3-methyl-5-hydroxy-6-metoxy-1,4-benzoquinol methylase